MQLAVDGLLSQTHTELSSFEKEPLVPEQTNMSSLLRPKLSLEIDVEIDRGFVSRLLTDQLII